MKTESTNPTKLKKELIPGKRYKGYGVLNEYGEFMFEPEETGAHAGREKVIFASQGLRISETKKLIMVKFNLEKQTEKYLYVQALMKIYNLISKKIMNYDF